MSEFTELLRFLYGAGTSIIPWILVGLCVWIVVSLKPQMVAYFESKKKAEEDMVIKEGERNEVIRNCSATIEACTTVLEMVKNDNQRVIDHVDEHENMSKERMEHIQTVVNQCRDEIIKARGDLKGINTQLSK